MIFPNYLCHPDNGFPKSRVVFNRLLHKDIGCHKTCVTAQLTVSSMKIGGHPGALIVEDKSGGCQAFYFVYSVHFVAFFKKDRPTLWITMDKWFSYFLYGRDGLLSLIYFMLPHFRSRTPNVR